MKKIIKRHRVLFGILGIFVAMFIYEKSYDIRGEILFCEFSNNHYKIIKEKNYPMDFPQEFIIYFEKEGPWTHFFPMVDTNMKYYDSVAIKDRFFKNKSFLTYEDEKHDDDIWFSIATWPDAEEKYYNDKKFPYRIIHLRRDTLDLKIVDKGLINIAHCRTAVSDWRNTSWFKRQI